MGRCLVVTSSLQREIRQFRVVVVQRRQRNAQKSVIHLQSCFFFAFVVAKADIADTGVIRASQHRC